MKILLREIKSTGLEVNKSLAPESLGLDDKSLNFLNPIEVSAKIEKLRDSVLARTKVKARIEYVCARCLEPFTDERIEEYYFDFPVDRGTKFIDLGDDIRQELILEFAIRALCRPDCKGVCITCGKNLNIEQCSCPRKH